MVFFHGLCFLGFVGTEAAEHLVEIYLVCIKLGSVHADKLGFAANSDTTRAAHTGTIHHDCIETCFGRDIVFLGGQRNEFHHNSGTDGDTFVHLFALDNLLDAYGNYTFLSHRAVIGHDQHFVRPLFELLTKDDEVFVTCCEYCNDAVSGTFECFSDRQHRRCANTSTRTYDRTVILYARGFAKRADHIVQRITGIERQQFMGGNTYLLDHERNRTSFDVRTRNSKRHTFGLLVHADDNKMSCSTTARDERRFNHYLSHIGREKTLRKNFIHSDIIKNGYKSTKKNRDKQKKCTKIWSCQKNVVPLHAFSRQNEKIIHFKTSIEQ